MTWVWMSSSAGSWQGVLCENIPLRLPVALFLLRDHLPVFPRGCFILGTLILVAGLNAANVYYLWHKAGCWWGWRNVQAILRLGIHWSWELRRKSVSTVSVFLVFLCFPVCLFLVYCWRTEIRLCILHSKWTFWFWRQGRSMIFVIDGIYLDNFGILNVLNFLIHLLSANL